MSGWFNPTNWYWSVGDLSPSTQVWQGSTGQFVVLANADYVAFLAAGNFATVIDTLDNLYIVINTFNATILRPGYVSFAISGGNLSLTSTPSAPLPKVINISSIDTSGRNIILPQENLFGTISNGDQTTITNKDTANNVNVFSNLLNTLVISIPFGGAAVVIQTQNPGLWDAFYLGNSITLVPPIPANLGGTGTESLGQLPATATNDSATAGNLGEEIESLVASGSALPLTTNTAANVTSVSLTAGDWEVWGTAQFSFAATTNVTDADASISLTSAMLDATADRYVAFPYTGAGIVPGSGFPLTLKSGPIRVSLSTTTTIYMVGRLQFSVSTATLWGAIVARRMR